MQNWANPHLSGPCTMYLIAFFALSRMGCIKSPDFDYFFERDLVSKYDQLKEPISSGKAQIIKELSGYREDIKFLYLTHVFHYFIEKQTKRSLSELQQVSNISNTCWNHA